MTSESASMTAQESMQGSAAPVSVSVLIPTIGRPEFIVDTVRSVLRQSFTDLEVLISDNAPAVPTRELLAAAGIHDERIRIVERRSRVPFSEHMNLCLADASGEFFMILSDDDQIAPDYIGQAMQVVRAQPAVTVVLGRQHRVSGSERGLFEREALGSLCVLPGETYLRGILEGTLVTGVLTQISMFARRLQALSCGGFAHYPDGSHADNRLLWRMNLTRLDAESVRDSLLAIAGKLDLTSGGPPAQWFWFKDDHSPVYDYARFDPDDPASYRRSIYRFIVRSVPDPFMERLDCPDPSVLTPKRTTTLTAIQALTMLNNPFVVRMAEHLGERMKGDVAYAVRLCWGRDPQRHEVEQFTTYAKKHGAAALARVLFNSNEFLFVD